MNKTQIILKYCRLADGGRKEHALWCELETGLWHTCDCGRGDELGEKYYLLHCFLHKIY